MVEPNNMADSEHPETGPQNGWEPCAPGEISGMVDQIQGRRRAIVVGRTTFVAAMVLLFAAASQFSGFQSADSEHDCGGIMCSEVMAHLDAYRAGTLDEATSEKVRDHLGECPVCGPHFRKMTGSSAGNSRKPTSDLAMAFTLLQR